MLSRRTRRMWTLPRCSETIIDWPCPRHDVSLGRAHGHRKAAARPSPSQPPGRPAPELSFGAHAEIAVSENEQAVGFIERACPFASNVHSADGHDGRDDGVDFLGELSTAETKCAKGRRESVPVGLREKGRDRGNAVKFAAFATEVLHSGARSERSSQCFR
jgi:hypothetical protein